MLIGVLGTMVWDRIEHPDVEPVERWGGIAYSLAAASAALPADWSVRPIMRVGRDLAAETRAFLDRVPGLDRSTGVREVDEPANRVHLRYHDPGHRHECLTGGVGPWPWEELEPTLEGVDALYINMISGFELGPEVAGRAGRAVDGPVYIDIHSLVLDLEPGGGRVPRPLGRRAAWLDAVDLVQANERELALVADEEEPAAFARRAVAEGLGALFVTEGPRGATWYAREDAERPWRRREGGAPDGVVSERVPVEDAVPTGDPTGCGDVWGATCFVALLRGETVSDAVASANRMAARNVAYRGAEGLEEHLRGTP